MPDTPPPPHASPAQPVLRRSLGVLDGVAIAASSTAATTSIGIGLGVTAGVVGLHLPAIMLLAFLPVLGIAAPTPGSTASSRTQATAMCGWAVRSLPGWASWSAG